MNVKGFQPIPYFLHSQIYFRNELLTKTTVLKLKSDLLELQESVSTSSSSAA